MTTSSNTETAFGAAPLIIIGTHRSGTSVLAQCLNQAGIFMGSSLSSHHEAYFFLRRNQAIFQNAGARWDKPQPVTRHLESPDTFEPIVKRYRRDMGSMKAASFLGLARYARCRSVLRNDQSWGWKDPRNSFTLPVWRGLFPNARLLHIHRNGIAVAASLRARERKRSPSSPLYSEQCTTFEGAFGVWAEYEASCLQHLDAWDRTQTMSLPYESFLNSPESLLTDIFALTKTAPDANRIEDAAATVNPNSQAHLEDTDEFQKFVATALDHPLMQRYGYREPH